ncbi:alpha/beta family hydrolase [Ornithinimicrobium tianjinense]|uniref:KANL3/Tex30 alpha/beta hydrolase-like domain-containing protein n=1 Tax=Ornithinimicrobium tianjinense TaxID=1195761 RepID=A0A917BYP7_9MICO|nr:alpha/beta family hydrolase [Ornithinimicrobium tianjinense]GGF59963.1 hypothetical protein GCM10011366_29770 [Ornithinimicrobium tianjinense]
MTSAAASVAALPRTDVPTAEGTAQVRVLPSQGATHGTLLLGHGAGGRGDAADVVALTALTADGWTVVLVDQPWRVAGRKVAMRPPSLDRAFADLTAVLADEDWQASHGIPLPRPWVLGGRSAGARVACRAAVDEHGVARPGIAGVVCLAFPLHPPGAPEKSRAAELEGPLAAGLPTLVVQGARDPFGTPEEVRAAVRDQRACLVLHEVPGTHSPSRDLAAVTGQARQFLAGLGGRPAAGALA